jgi:hydroxymethylpyrimidine pyrophosphatase-like HAD family hydrolase
MRYLALACDYDGTLAWHGRVDDETVSALERVLASGRKLILVTGRELPDLELIFPNLKLFDRIVAENGALLYRPASRETRRLCEEPSSEFVRRLQLRQVQPLSVGQCIVATWQPQESIVLETIRELGLELQVIFNKGAVMVLPSGINKGTGLRAALRELGLSAHSVVGVGDAENDHAFLNVCECSVAVANGLESLKQRADVVTRGERGAGVRELIRNLLDSDLADWESRLGRRAILLGHDDDGQPVSVRPYGEVVLIAGPSGSGKSTVATAVLERLAAHGYQFCLIDPEGDFEGFPEGVCIGSEQHAPASDELLQLLERFESTVVNLLGVTLADRPGVFAAALHDIQQLRARTGRPHWLILDEAHHLLPESWRPAPITIPQVLESAMLITVHPDHVSPAALAAVTTVLAVGPEPWQTINTFCAATGEAPPAMSDDLQLDKLEVLAWFRGRSRPPFRVRVEPGSAERRRHRRKYAYGDIHDKSFYFRGPEGKLNLRAQNLALFVQIAEGVDDQTWMHHLRQGDYSRWVRESIKDEKLAEEIRRVEVQDVPTDRSRAQIKEAIEQKYTSAA